MKTHRLSQHFVKSFPDSLEPGVLYISMDYDTTIHLCACGCGNQVVLPIHPTAWKLTYNGETVSMTPSVGNWSFPCRSHYVIERGHIRWAPAWSDAQVAAGRKRTLQERGIPLETDSHTPSPISPGLWQRLKRLTERYVRRT